MPSIYKELDSQLGEAYIGLRSKDNEKINPIDSIDAVFVRTGEFKYHYLNSALNTFLPSEVIYRLEPLEEETREWAGRPDMVAAYKAFDTTNNLIMYAHAVDKGSQPEEVILSLANDVQLCDKDGFPIYKPEGCQTKDEIFDQLVAGLSSTENCYKVKSGLAVCDGSYIITANIDRTFNFSAFSKSELELYVFGIQGKNEDYPQYLENELQQLVNKGLIDASEISFYSKGLTLEELQQTSGGYRWPHPIFMQHIEEINGTRSGDPTFGKKANELFMSLVGMTPELYQFLSEATNKLIDQKDDAKTFTRLVMLKDGSFAELRYLDICSDDLRRVSSLIQENFLSHPHYRDISEEARLAYIQANEPENLEETCNHPQHIEVLGIEQLGQLLGVCVLRKNGHNLAEVRRLHTKYGLGGQGVGSLLLQEASYIASDRGYSGLATIASGRSDTYFAKHGFTIVVPKHPNGKLAAKGVEAPVTYMEKLFKYA